MKHRAFSVLCGLWVASARCTQSRPVCTTQEPVPAEVRVAGIVLKWVKGDKPRNYGRAEPLIREAAARGARIVITTECFLDGYAIRDKTISAEGWRDLSERIPGGPYLGRLQSLARELGIYLVAGMVEASDEKTYNTAVMIAPDGRILGKYHKQMLEHELWRNTPGSENPVFETAYGRIGLIICADRRHPEIVRRVAQAGADWIICPSGGMWGPEKNDFHLQDRSRENSLPIVFVHPIEFLVTGPDGTILDRRFAGKKMEVTADGVGGPEDVHLVALYDLPLRKR